MNLSSDPREKKPTVYSRCSTRHSHQKRWIMIGSRGANSRVESDGKLKCLGTAPGLKIDFDFYHQLWSSSATQLLREILSKFYEISGRRSLMEIPHQRWRWKRRKSHVRDDDYSMMWIRVICIDEHMIISCLFAPMNPQWTNFHSLIKTTAFPFFLCSSRGLRISRCGSPSSSGSAACLRTQHAMPV